MDSGACMPTVGLCACPDYDEKTLLHAVEELFSLCGFGQLIKPEMNILIKPNLIMGRAPERVATTHPGLVAAVTAHLQALGAKNITIADSSGGVYTPVSMRSVYRETGMAAVAEKYGVSVNTDTASSDIVCPEGKRCRIFTIIKPVTDADLIINIAKLKTHMMTRFSGATKNMFGAVPGLLKPELHCRYPDKDAFGEMLVDLCELVKPHINIIDAVLCMEGNGPTGGSPRKMGALIGGENSYACDIVACELIHLPYKTVHYLSSAIDRGLCPAGISGIDVVGRPMAEFDKPDFRHADDGTIDFVDFLPRFLRRPARRFVTPKPVIDMKKCVGCGKCAESCPQKTMTIRDKKVYINYSGCIKCFCCHEICPFLAINIKRNRLFDLMGGRHS